jgi:GntR family transcriptional repressor for pyruvate dehydrogenase complex
MHNKRSNMILRKETPVSAKNQNASRAFQIVIRRIQHDIQNKKLRPGDRLAPERQLAESLGVSRATIREAIRALEMIGLVVSRQGEGNFISDRMDLALLQPMTISFYLGGGSLYDIHHFRQSLEIEATGLAAADPSPDFIAHLTNLADQMDAAPDIDTSADLDNDFHQSIAAASGNCLIRDSLTAATTLLETVRYQARVAIITREKDEGDALCFQHRRIADAIAAKDSPLARKRMLEHMIYVEDFLSDISPDKLPDLAELPAKK